MNVIWFKYIKYKHSSIKATTRSMVLFKNTIINKFYLKTATLCMVLLKKYISMVLFQNNDHKQYSVKNMYKHVLFCFIITIKDWFYLKATTMQV